ncbi:MULTISPECIES: ABC transporter ATP-binding protein [Methylobacterium]|jgi:branched-chain amino acid transport system ATP-binding protein|uniref:ABC transporter ATP-binding protein n=1 Tax=Methylobacterium TaxID=407 RepID=UPI0008E18ADA|nr:MULTISPECIES: ABC transporter ATP-binding protein [Methylobacterium]MBZ6413344.1 ABC transporter ATP-binding protein [Methylobacterium sp.]MBK3400575.1 ABC transporter ATP-binding protein [Methylobacterium ajmalii]MBK3409630.1 ABC transporter ATP-binding protein [Methylobacterium ajmalii]MBK3423424.1 ABC transporter ATP-binding protein [Methylobacterium ajmalii]SFF45125.1 amino acid/amide ABC transporter ATP-binding protein 2, HAAT family [Methylobacterium sp. yr596]
MTVPMLEAHAVSVAYGKVEAVRGVSLSVAPGRLVTVLGANGAGKTTLLNALMGVLPAKGTLRFEGRDLTRLPVEARVALGLSLIPERRELFSTMTVEDNLKLGAFRFRTTGGGGDLGEIYRLFPRLAERRRQQAGTLSGGERQMLAMARALMGRPRLLMLDEPSLGLAPLIVAEVMRTVARLRDEGVAILLVEQNARAALRIADHGYVLDGGRVVLEGDSRTLQADARVAETYLGSLGAETPDRAAATG